MKPEPIFDPNIKEQLFKHLGVPNNRIIDFEYKDTGRTVRKHASAIWLIVFQYRTAMAGLGYSKWKIDEFLVDDYITEAWGEVVFLPLIQQEQIETFVVHYELPTEFEEPVSKLLRQLSIVQNGGTKDCDDDYQMKMHVSTTYMTSEFQYVGCANNRHSHNDFFTAVETLTNYLVKTTAHTAMQEFVENHWWQIE